jgi:GT2 family glycosyltransferase
MLGRVVVGQANIEACMSRVPVIIPFYREYAKLAKCQEHLAAQSYSDIEVFVRDNTNDNILFTAAVNEGLRKFCYDAAIRYVLILNQDAYLAPNAIQLLVEFLDQHPDSGIACPLQVTAEGKVDWGGSLQAFPYGAHRCDPLESYVTPSETYWANGAALLVRTEVVREVGLWDWNMRFICSDVDFSFSTRARGWKIHVVPEARCEHRLGGSLGADPVLQPIMLRDALYFACKWVSGDLYRRLAYEGPKLTDASVRDVVGKMTEHLLQMVEARAESPPE